MALEIKEDVKVVRHNIHLTCMTVLLDVAGHGVHITQQGWAYWLMPAADLIHFCAGIM